MGGLIWRLQRAAWGNVQQCKAVHVLWGTSSHLPVVGIGVSVHQLHQCHESAEPYRSLGCWTTAGNDPRQQRRSRQPCRPGEGVVEREGDAARERGFGAAEGCTDLCAEGGGELCEGLCEAALREVAWGSVGTE